MKIARSIEMTRECISRFLDYDASTGCLRWKVRSPEMFASKGAADYWNKRYAGTVAGTVKRVKQGCEYIQIKVGGRLYLAHRLIWILISGAISDELAIDHRNGNGLDNRQTNLRLVTPAINGRNAALRSDSASGVAGVYWSSREGRWHAQIKAGGVRRSLGYHDSFEAAVSARRTQEASNGYYPLHGLPSLVRAAN